MLDLVWTFQIYLILIICLKIRLDPGLLEKYIEKGCVLWFCHHVDAFSSFFPLLLETDFSLDNTARGELLSIRHGCWRNRFRNPELKSLNTPRCTYKALELPRRTNPWVYKNFPRCPSVAKSVLISPEENKLGTGHIKLDAPCCIPGRAAAGSWASRLSCASVSVI